VQHCDTNEKDILLISIYITIPKLSNKEQSPSAACYRFITQLSNRLYYKVQTEL